MFGLTKLNELRILQLVIGSSARNFMCNMLDLHKGKCTLHNSYNGLKGPDIEPKALIVFPISQVY